MSAEQTAHPAELEHRIGPGAAEHPLAGREVSLVDLLDRLLAGGVVLTGDVTLSIAGVDLVHISLRALITSVKADRPSPLRW
ncbi:gas vesicle protein [Amycolatopsis minnesotensis]|uniref:Gas vesicle protein n=1 Tax=Amycolatopsis minnesotensis TaxID=337894 RepID=A0ABN2QBY9_9PSEU